MRLLLIEDSTRLQTALTEGFKRAGFAIDVVGDGLRGLTYAKREEYDAIILDLMLPCLDGLELLTRLREIGSQAYVLVLTARDTVEDRVEGLRRGADDYVVKPFSFEELLARVQALVRRRYRSPNARIEVGDLVLDTAGRTVLRGGEEVRLTRREYRVLEYLVRRRGQTVDRVEIEDHVYGESNLPSSNAVDSAVCNLRRKLGRKGSQAPLIHTRHGLGYCLDVLHP